MDPTDALVAEYECHKAALDGGSSGGGASPLPRARGLQGSPPRPSAAASAAATAALADATAFATASGAASAPARLFPSLWSTLEPTWPAALPFPSPEQLAICEALISGTSCIVSAVAGSGKTTTMLQTALALSRKDSTARTLVVCYNKKLQSESCERVQRLVEAGALPGRGVVFFTVHALAQQVYDTDCRDDAGLIIW